jgi:diphthamide biosynthesis protein 2
MAGRAGRRGIGERARSAGAQGHILDSKEYLAPVITPAEALAAFTGAPYSGAYSADFGAVLAAAAAPPAPPRDGEPPPGLALALAQGAAPLAARGPGALAPAGSAAEFLAHRRTWRGLETPLTGAPALAAAPAAAGRSGLAAGYDDEPGRR